MLTVIGTHNMKGDTMTEQTLGQMIGSVEDNFKVTNSAGDEIQLRVKFDYSTCSDNDIRSWLNGNRRITMQRPLRGLSVDEIKALDGTTIMANECGRKVKSREEQIATIAAVFTSKGIDDTMAMKLATTAVDNPQLLTTTTID